MQKRGPNVGVMEKLTADRNVIVSDKPMVQINLNQCNKEDILFSGTEIEMVGFDITFICFWIRKLENDIHALALLISLPFVSCAITLKESYGQESSDSSGEEWSAFSTPRKAKLLEKKTASLPESLSPAKRCSRRAPATEQNNEHTPQSEQLHGSASEQQTEVLCSNVSSGKASEYHFGPIVSQVYNISSLLV